MIITKEITMFLLRNGMNEFYEFRKQINASRKFRSYFNKDYSTFERADLRKAQYEISSCYRILNQIEILSRGALKANTTNLENEVRRINVECQRRNSEKSTRVCNRRQRQEAARINRGNGKSKNR